MAYVRKRKQTLEQSMAILRGDEPVVTKDNYRSDLAKALNWYNANWEEKDYRKSAENYILKHMKLKDAAYALSKAQFLEVRSIGSLGRLIMNEQYVDLDHVQKMFEQIESLKAKYIKPTLKVVENDRPVVVAPSVQDRILESARNIAGDVEEAIDQYTLHGTEFSMKSLLLSNQVSGAVSRKVGELFKPMLVELDEAYKGTCPQLKEAYGHMGRRRLKAFVEFVQQIVADCDQQVVSAKAQRKPRARKAKPASVIVRKMNYMREFPAFKLKSVPAESIVGAAELWCYNTTSRKLIVYYGAEGGPLNVSGSSITNFDVAKSAAKTLRKPEEFFKGITSTGKRAMATAWKGVKAKVSSPRARINGDVVLIATN